jgi:hypothetical protein
MNQSNFRGHFLSRWNSLRQGKTGLTPALVLGVAWLLGATSAFGTGNLVITPGSGAASTGFARGPFSATDFNYTVRNSGGGNLNWSVGKNQPWISISEESGTLAGGVSKVLDVRVNSLALSLPAGTHTATLSFINLTVLGTETRTVTLLIGVPGPGTAAAETVELLNRYRITLTGTSGSTYVVEDAPAVTGPWDPVITNTFSGGSAAYEFTVMSEPGRYFRSVSSGSGAVGAAVSVARVQGIDNTLVKVTGAPNGIYIIESTINSVNWVPVYTNKVPASGSFIFTNALAASQPNVTYRAVAAGALTLPTINQILIAGESLAVGFDGVPALSVTPMGNNYRYRRDGGVFCQVGWIRVWLLRRLQPP